MDNYFVRFKKRKEDCSFSVSFNMTLNMSMALYERLIEAEFYEVQWGKTNDPNFDKFTSGDSDAVAYGIRQVKED